MKNGYVDEIRKRLNAAIQGLPPGFYNTFDYVATGNNRCHSSTLGLLAPIIAGLEGVASIGIDVPLKRGAAKMKPDVVGYDAEGREIVYVDFESPNSSDARVKIKDIDPYVAYRVSEAPPVPYVIITSLPDCASPEWQLRWTSGQQYNHQFRGMGEKLRKNPFQFWRTRWRTMLSDIDMSGITLLNIDRKSVEPVKL